MTLQDIQFRRGTQSFYTNNNPLLLIGEPAFESDTYKFKIGNGVDRWNQLPYVTGSGGPESIISVNNKTGIVVIDADDIDSSSTTNKFVTASGLNKLNFITITSSINLNTLQNTANSALQSYTETDPVYSVSPASNITASDITKLSNLSGTNTGDQNASDVTVSPSINTNSNVQTVLTDHESRIDNIEGSAVVDTRTYVNGTSSGITGIQNGINVVFTVAEGSYVTGSLLVFVSGFPLCAGQGLTETTPESGIFTLDSAPLSYEIIIAQYSN